MIPGKRSALLKAADSRNRARLHIRNGPAQPLA
jgi:hypothetical protein